MKRWWMLIHVNTAFNRILWLVVGVSIVLLPEFTVKADAMPGAFAFGFVLISALLLTIAVDMLVGFVYLLIFKLPRALLKWVAIIPIITLPIATGVVLPVFLNWLPNNAALFVTEGLIVVFEGAFLYWRGRMALSPLHAYSLSFIVNAASYLAGLWFFTPFCILCDFLSATHTK